MKIFLKILFLSSLVHCNITMYSQNIEAKAGTNISTFLASDFNNTDKKVKTGLHFGATIEFPLYGRLSAETGISYINKGVNKEGVQTFPTAFEYQSKTSLHYLEVPLVFRVNFNKNVFGFGGIYMAVGLAGKFQRTDIVNNETTIIDDKLTFGSNANQLNLFDSGILVGGGFYTGKFRWTLSCSQGGTAINKPTPQKNFSELNTVFSFSLAYPIFDL